MNKKFDKTTEIRRGKLQNLLHLMQALPSISSKETLEAHELTHKE
jgi:hypothetical protein